MLNILKNENGLIFAIKPIGVCSEDGQENSMPVLLKKQLDTDYIATLHRLDTAVSGVMVYAYQKSAAAEVSAKIQNNELRKEYLAVVAGVPEEKSGTLCDLLFKDSRKNKSYVVARQRAGVKKAILEYEVLETTDTDNGPVSLIKINLITGRSHQIRVQFSHRKMPLLGDKKYGSRHNGNIALFSHGIALPYRGNEIKVTALPEVSEFPWSLFKNY